MNEKLSITAIIRSVFGFLLLLRNGIGCFRISRVRRAEREDLYLAHFNVEEAND
jgi:hypothetical protein